MFDSLGKFLVVTGFRAWTDDGARCWMGTWAIYELTESGDWERLACGRHMDGFNDAHAAEMAAHEIGMAKARRMLRKG
jgi:hypothetical protein